MAPRADARRNYARILAVADDEVATHGPQASLEQIARVAGVGSATVRRHFPTRQALVEAVSRSRVAALSDRARALAYTHPGAEALVLWLREVVSYCVDARALATALSYESVDDAAGGDSCSAELAQAAGPLLDTAIRDGAVRADVTATDLVALAVGAALATEFHADPAGRADALLRLSLAGIGPVRPAR
ncbi:TetR/AcrR family transcriptional regulator [Phycicoccus avicenniae]|uniref:TetR/AcrR family transcriptional regulator n=1 Tax=Phycicoccus avicenniae TaxID=2828860 RepID=UPI003D270383